jgi:hypothetical protein
MVAFGGQSLQASPKFSSAGLDLLSQFGAADLGQIDLRLETPIGPGASRSFLHQGMDGAEPALDGGDASLGKPSANVVQNLGFEIGQILHPLGVGTTNPQPTPMQSHGVDEPAQVGTGNGFPGVGDAT